MSDELTLAELREIDAGPREGCTDACCKPIRNSNTGSES